MKNFLNYDNKYYNGLFIFLFFILIRKQYIYYCKNLTFKRLENLFPRKLLWEKDLNIYSLSMPIFYSNIKKKTCILLISGFRDIPYIWKELGKYFEDEKLDYYAPRTFGTGRTFFQNSCINDWILTYLEAIMVLQNLYEEIEIIAFSAGSIIALYLSQFKYKCKIKNIILLAPFLLKQKGKFDFLFDNSFSLYIDPIINFFYPFRIKTPEYNFKYCRDIYFEENAQKDYYELTGYINLELKLLKFKNLRPKQILANNIIIFCSKNDLVIGNIYEQQQIIMNIIGNIVPIIFIPDTSVKNEIGEKILCGHVMLKEHPLIIKNIYDYLKIILINNNINLINEIYLKSKIKLFK